MNKERNDGGDDGDDGGVNSDFDSDCGSLRLSSVVPSDVYRFLLCVVSLQLLGIPLTLFVLSTRLAVPGALDPLKRTVLLLMHGHERQALECSSARYLCTVLRVPWPSPSTALRSEYADRCVARFQRKRCPPFLSPSSPV